MYTGTIHGVDPGIHRFAKQLSPALRKALQSLSVTRHQAARTVQNQLCAGGCVVQLILSRPGCFQFGARGLQFFILQIEFDLVHLQLMQQGQGIVGGGR